MLFNSYVFILFYFPMVFGGMFWLGKHSHRLAALWLAFASLTFYAMWDVRFVLLLLASIMFNYGAGYWIGLARVVGASQPASKYPLIIAITVNLILLCYCKYANFFIASANQVVGSHIPALNIMLPLGISFFTFTQIAFLVDVYRGIAREVNFIHYLLFVTYFPHLIAGPVLHHKQMMPQFAQPSTFLVNPEHVAVGLTAFVLGLAQKVLLADNLAESATPVFTAARDGQVLMLFESWIGALAYTLQLYFDFSGYCDMAIGLSLMCNIRLPVNFDSPYQATSIIDFWRRWHMTLSSFLRDYLYFPLGGNRKGPIRRYVNLMVTMLLGGLWHGAGWTFIVWGGLHGVYLLINHGWRDLKNRLGWGKGDGGGHVVAGTLTFLAVVVAWVFFRADKLSSAWSIVAGMAGINGVSLPTSCAERLAVFTKCIPHLPVVFQGLVSSPTLNINKAVITIVIGLILVWFFPNVRQMLADYNPTWEDIYEDKTFVLRPSGRLSSWLTWQPNNRYWLAIVGTIFGVSLSYLGEHSEFLYFQF